MGPEGRGVTRDPLRDPQFGDVFEWRDSGYRVLYLGARPGQLWFGTCISAGDGAYRGQLGETTMRAPLRRGWRAVDQMGAVDLSTLTTEQIDRLYRAAVKRGLIR